MFRASILLMMCAVPLSLIACDKTPQPSQTPTGEVNAPQAPAEPKEAPKEEPKVEEAAKPPAFEGASSASELVLVSFKAVMAQDYEQVQALVMPASQQLKYCPKQEIKTQSKETVLEQLAACKEQFATRLDGAQPIIDTFVKTYKPLLIPEDSALCENASVYFSTDITYQTDTPETGIFQYIFKPGDLIQADGKWWLAEAPNCFFNAPG